LSKPIEAKSREWVGVELRSNSSEEAGTHLAWTAIHRNGQGAVLTRQAHDLDKGYLP
jgi:protein arginine N-methyltransferase 1